MSPVEVEAGWAQQPSSRVTIERSGSDEVHRMLVASARPYVVTQHSDRARDLLRRASLAQETAMSVEGAERLEELASDDYESMAPEWLRSAIMSDRRSVVPTVTQHKEDSMAVKTRKRTSTRTKSATAKSKVRKAASSKRNGASSSGPKSATKAQVVQIAKLRREGATWDEVIAETGVKTNSTGFRILLEENGFDKFGRKGGKGKSQARGYGSAQIAK